MATRLDIAWKDIQSYFDSLPTTIQSRPDIEKVLREHREFWRLAQSTTAAKFIAFLQAKGRLQEFRIELPYRPTTRFVWGTATAFEIVQSLNREGYLSHYSGILLHGLTEQHPKTIYFNVEQPSKGTGGQLTQEGIDRAFRGNCRTSQNITQIMGFEVCVLNGRNTEHLGVVSVETPHGRSLRVTNIERTLIDIAVRPIYSGGVFEVAKAYREARGKYSLNKLAAYLHKLQYGYPIHQAIGFYLERSAAYSRAQLMEILDFDRRFDFYLTHGMKEMDYVPEWRLYIPKGF